MWSVKGTGAVANATHAFIEDSHQPGEISKVPFLAKKTWQTLLMESCIEDSQVRKARTIISHFETLPLTAQGIFEALAKSVLSDNLSPPHEILMAALQMFDAGHSSAQAEAFRTISANLKEKSVEDPMAAKQDYKAKLTMIAKSSGETASEFPPKIFGFYDNVFQGYWIQYVRSTALIHISSSAPLEVINALKLHLKSCEEAASPLSRTSFVERHGLHAFLNLA